MDKKTSGDGKDLHIRDINSIRNKNDCEIGAEWMSYREMRQLRVAPFLASGVWDAEEIKLYLSHIICRSVYPVSELETNRWMRENSAICEVTGYDIENITKGCFYNITKKLYSEKEASVQD